MPNLTYTVSPFLPFTKIVSADVNQYFTDIKTLFNTTKLDSTNVQLHGLTRDRLAAGTANFAVFNDASGFLTEAAQLPLAQGGLGTGLSLATNQGKAIIVNPSETALVFGSPSQAQLTQSFASDIGSLTAGEAISANDAVCLDLGLDGSSNYIYRVFKSDASKANRKYNHIGFAVSPATVTAGTYTWVASANFVTGNSIAFSINGRSYTVAFSTSNTVTLQAVATAMATDPDVNGAVSDGVHTITVTGKGGLFVNITGSVVTGGGSQPTITVTNTLAPSGQNVQIRNFGDLAGFTLLTGRNYYLDQSAGAITNAPADPNPVFVGQAMSTSTLFTNKNVGQFQFTTPVIFVRSHGTTTASEVQGTQDNEHFNFVAWQTGTASAAGARAKCNGQGDQSYAGFLHELGGYDTGTSVTQLFQRYNKSTWSSLANNVAACARTAGSSFNGYYYRVGGVVSGGSPTDVTEKWDGAAWATRTVLGSNDADLGCFVYSGSLHVVAGSAGAVHRVLDTSDTWSSATASPTGGWSAASSATATAGYYVDGAGTVTNSYRWAGSWSSAIVVTYSIADAQGVNGAAGVNTGNGLAIVNGGSISSAALTTSAYFNDVAWAAGTASNTARGGSIGGVF